MNVADYIVKYLEEKGVKTVFMITGGQAMFLNDAVYKSKKIEPIFHHHEQAASMAAEAYGRIRGEIGVLMVTAGPGAINALNGVIGGWADSAPMMVISGQSNLENVSYMENTSIRQLGLQGVFTKPLAQSATKYFITVDDPAKILFYLEKAFYLANNGRKGPVWLEVPLNVQRMEVPVKLLKGFKPENNGKKNDKIDEFVKKTVELLFQGKRPLLLAGQGVRLGGAIAEFGALCNKAKIPVITTRLGIDLIDEESRLFVGRPGLYGDRAANFAVQNADLIISLGARLDTGIVGYEPKDWGRHAKKIVVDIDIEELNKPGITADIKIESDVCEFLTKLNKQVSKLKMPEFDDWINICQSWRKRYPMVKPSYKKEKLVNSYFLTERLSNAANSKDTIVIDTSSCFHVVCQSWKIKNGQRFITTGGISTMGYWVAGIGACIANNRGRTIVITGDGSFQMNIQELATIKQNRLPVKIFVINNEGYLLIRHTQKTHLGGRLMGESPQTGMWSPNPLDVAKAYKIRGVNITSANNIDKKIREVLDSPDPVVCNVSSPHWQLIIPRIASEKKSDGTFISKPYEDMFPFLPEKELKENMVAETEKRVK